MDSYAMKETIGFAAIMLGIAWAFLTMVYFIEKRGKAQ